MFHCCWNPINLRNLKHINHSSSMQVGLSYSCFHKQSKREWIGSENLYSSSTHLYIHSVTKCHYIIQSTSLTTVIGCIRNIFSSLWVSKWNFILLPTFPYPPSCNPTYEPTTHTHTHNIHTLSLLNYYFLSNFTYLNFLSNFNFFLK